MTVKLTAREIADELHKQISSGKIKPGEQLYFKNLAARYDVSKATLQRTMALLKDRRLAVYMIGIGWFVDDSAKNP